MTVWGLAGQRIDLMAVSVKKQQPLPAVMRACSA
jgi:hypothetical protein